MTYKMLKNKPTRKSITCDFNKVEENLKVDQRKLIEKKNSYKNDDT